MDEKTCGGCGAAGSGNFCASCGDEMAKSVSAGDLDAALNALGEMAKANAAIDEDFAVEGVDPGELFDLDATFAKSESAADPDAPMDATPVLAAIGNGQAGIAQLIYGLGNEVRSLRRENGYMAKALSIVGAAVRETLPVVEMTKAIHAELEEWGGRTRGPRSRQAVIGIPERRLGDTATTPKAEPFDRGAFMAKAHAAYDAGKLTLDELISAETWTNQGGTPASIKESDPALGSRLETAVSSITQ